MTTIAEFKIWFIERMSDGYTVEEIQADLEEARSLVQKIQVYDTSYQEFRRALGKVEEGYSRFKLEMLDMDFPYAYEDLEGDDAGVRDSLGETKRFIQAAEQVLADPSSWPSEDEDDEEDWDEDEDSEDE